MSECPLFAMNVRADLEEEVKRILNEHEEFLSEATAESTRAVGDAIERIVSDSFRTILGDWASDYSGKLTRKAMADFAFEERNGYHVRVDVKTHRMDTAFNMPNLTSVDRLAAFYEGDKNVFSVMVVSYRLVASRPVVEKVYFVPIEHLSWDCLTIGALGWGQIQIANANRISIVTGNTRKAWMLELCDRLFEFYPKEQRKIERRIDRFQDVRAFWTGRADGP